MDPREYKLNKINATAAWTGALTGIISLLIISAQYFQQMTEREESRKEKIILSGSRVNHDYATVLSRTGASRGYPRGLLSVFWDILIINNSEMDISIKSYKLICIEPQNVVFDYDEGLFLPNFEPATRKLIIPAGQSTNLYLKANLLLPWNVLEKAYEKFGWNIASIDSISSFFKFLYSNDVDCFGNHISTIWGEKSLVFSDETRNQKFLFSITTGRNTVMQDTLFWYKKDKEHYYLWPKTAYWFSILNAK